MAPPGAAEEGARSRRLPTLTDDNNAWGRQGREDGAYPPLAHAPREPRRNEQGPGNLLPRPSGWSPRRRSYLSFHDCAAWLRRVGPLALPSAPCLQQLRLAPPATGGARLRCVASTLCWLTGMENTSFPKPQKESTLRVLSFCGSGSYLSFHDCAAWSRRVGPLALPSAPCLQQLRLAPPATGGARLRCVASTLCWLASME